MVVAIDGFFHPLNKPAVLILRQQRIPIRTPNDFDDIPAGTGKSSFEFLNNFPVTAHRSVEALEIAINNPAKIVEPFASRECDCAERFRLVAFAIADERPDARLRAGNESACFEVPVKPRLING